MKNLSEQNEYKVYLEESWYAETDREAKIDKWRYYELRGKYGIVYPFSAFQLAVSVNSKKRLRKLGKVQIVQEGDQERTVLVDNSRWNEAAAVIEAKKKRKYSPEILAKLQQLGKNLSRKAVSKEKNDVLQSDKG